MRMSRKPNDAFGSVRDPRRDTKGILLLVDDDICRELLLDVLGSDVPVTVATTTLEARWLLGGAVAYRLVIVTSFGLPAEAALSVIPADQAWVTLFISGPLDERLRQECQRKGVRCLEAPFGVEQLREELGSLLP
jgi:hypothetical protein